MAIVGYETESLQGSEKSTGKPEAVNLVATDARALAMFFAVNYIIGSTCLKFLFAVAFLWQLLGLRSTLAGLITAIFCVPIHVFQTATRSAKERA